MNPVEKRDAIHRETETVFKLQEAIKEETERYEEAHRTDQESRDHRLLTHLQKTISGGLQRLEGLTDSIHLEHTWANLSNCSAPVWYPNPPQKPDWRHGLFKPDERPVPIL